MVITEYWYDHVNCFTDIRNLLIFDPFYNSLGNEGGRHYSSWRLWMKIRTCVYCPAHHPHYKFSFFLIPLNQIFIIWPFRIVSNHLSETSCTLPKLCKMLHLIIIISSQKQPDGGLLILWNFYALETPVTAMNSFV